MEVSSLWHMSWWFLVCLPDTQSTHLYLLCALRCWPLYTASPATLLYVFCLVWPAVRKLMFCTFTQPPLHLALEILALTSFCSHPFHLSPSGLCVFRISLSIAIPYVLFLNSAHTSVSCSIIKLCSTKHF